MSWSLPVTVFMFPWLCTMVKLWGEQSRVLGYVHTIPDSLASEQALRGALAAGREKEGELATTSLEFEFHLQFPCGSPSTELLDSANQREAETRANVNKHWKTRAKGNDITNVISANQSFASTLSMQIFKFQRRSCKLSFLSRPAARAPRRACSQATDSFLCPIYVSSR